MPPHDHLVQVLQRAAELDKTEREAFLARTVADLPALRSELEALLDADDHATWALGTGAALGGELVRELAARVEADRGAALIGCQVGAIRLDGILGEGGMGTVYRGFDTRLERPVAVKTVRLRGAEAASRFRDEARLLSAVEHPSICRVYDLIEAPECDYLVLELIEGRSLGAWARQGHSLDERLGVAEGIADVLMAAHQRGIVHRDLKPENVMVTGSGQVKVLDFGIAVLVPPETADSSPLDEAGPQAKPGTGPTAGTLLYMSPEQARGEPLGPSSDVFALGLMLQELVTDRPAYERSGTLDALLARVARGETAQLEGVEPELAELIAALQSPLPSRRPSAAEAARRIRERRAAPHRARRRRVLLALAAAVTTIVIASTMLVIRERFDAARTANEVQEIARVAEEVAWRMEVAVLLPSSDLSAVRQELAEAVAKLRARLPELPRVARPVAESAIGRAALALGELEAAREHLDNAWAAGMRADALAWTRGLLYGRLFSLARERERLLLGPAAEPGEESTRLRDEAIAMLSRAERTDQREHLEALLALFESRWEDGLSAVDRWLAATPGAWQAELVRAELLEGRADERYAASDWAEVVALTRARQEAAERAIAIARSHPDAMLERCQALFHHSWIRLRLLYEGDGVDAAAVDKACAEAAAVAPWSRPARTQYAGSVLISLHQTKALAELEIRAEEAWGRLGDLVEEAPEDLATRAWRAEVQQVVVERLFESGGSSRERIDRLLLDRQHLAEGQPGSPRAWIQYCRGLGASAMNAIALNWQDRGERVEHLSATLHAAAQRFPGWTFFSEQMRVVTDQLLVHVRLEEGGDCLTPLVGLEPVVEGGRTSSDPNIVRNAALVIDLGTACRLRDGLSPTPSYRDSIVLAERSIELAPAWAGSYFALGHSLLWVAEAERVAGRSPVADIRRAELAYARGLELEPTRGFTWTELAELRLVEAGWLLDQRRSTGSTLGQARAALDRARLALIESSELARLEARLRVLEARERLQGGEPLDLARPAARAAFEAAIDAEVPPGVHWMIERELDALERDAS